MTKVIYLLIIYKGKEKKIRYKIRKNEKKMKVKILEFRVYHDM